MPAVLFNSPLYGVFLVACFGVFWTLRKARLARALFLVVASYGFYFYGTYDGARVERPPLGPLAWSVLCLGIIFVGSTIDFWVGRALGREERPRARKALLLISIVYYLGVLSIFKYFNFAVDSFADAMNAMGLHVARVHLRIVLPFGISFFTFETMSYTIDVYRRELEPAKRYLDYLLFVAFFPHLVAGPIVRPKEMLPQFARAPVFDDAEQSRGLWLIAGGLVKKIIIGDFLAQNIVKRVFENPERFSSLEVLVAVYAYAIEIYADFSGYTDVALGSALLFGYRLPQNFDRPYAARNLQDFWHRWHMSLSTWLRDYLYIPLGGSRNEVQRSDAQGVRGTQSTDVTSRNEVQRSDAQEVRGTQSTDVTSRNEVQRSDGSKKGSLLTYRNLMITMILGGLWHGASWNYVIWGTLHGLALAGTRMWQRWRAARRKVPIGPEGESSPLPSRRGGSIAPRGPWYAHAFSVFCTFQYVCFAWIFFRAKTFEHAELVLGRLAAVQLGHANVSPRVVLVMAFAFAIHFVPKNIVFRVRDAFVRAPALVQGLMLAGVAFCLHAVAGAKAEPFVYGQF